MSNQAEVDSLAARLALADAILEAVKESGMLRKAKRRGSAQSAAAKKAAAARMRAYRVKQAKAKAAGTTKPAAKAKKSKAKAKPANPLANVPADNPAAA